MGVIAFKEEKKKKSLAVRNGDVFLEYNDTQTRLRSIKLNANKVIEMRENQLLGKGKLQEYTEICLIHAKKRLCIPIVQGSGRYCDHDNGGLRFSVPNNVRIAKAEMHNWHLR
ncbi:hypothetical protein ABID30_003241 [Enterococcus rotai]|uniref:hypothetical protein n=1 Tax=Enterococcus rotai TaxID=118060 RepID=UPI0033977615